MRYYSGLPHLRLLCYHYLVPRSHTRSCCALFSWPSARPYRSSGCHWLHPRFLGRLIAWMTSYGWRNCCHQQQYSRLVYYTIVCLVPLFWTLRGYWLGVSLPVDWFLVRLRLFVWTSWIIYFRVSSTLILLSSLMFSSALLSQFFPPPFLNSGQVCFVRQGLFDYLQM